MYDSKTVREIFGVHEVNDGLVWDFLRVDVFLLDITSLADEYNGAWVHINLNAESFFDYFEVILWRYGEWQTVSSIMLDVDGNIFVFLLLFLCDFYSFVVWSCGWICDVGFDCLVDDLDWDSSNL